MLHFYRQSKFPHNLRNLRVHFHVHNNTALVLTWATPFYATAVTRTVELSSHLRLDLLSGLYMITTQKPSRMSVLYYVCYVSSAAHSPSKYLASYHMPRYKYEARYDASFKVCCYFFPHSLKPSLYDLIFLLLQFAILTILANQKIENVLQLFHSVRQYHV